MSIEDHFTLQKHSDHLEFRIYNYPIWQGIQSAPGAADLLTLSISTSSDGLIRQKIADPDTESNTLLDYAGENYQFITPKPGEGDWGLVLGNQKVEMVTKAIAGSHPKSVLEIGGANTWVARQLINLLDIERYVLVDPALKTDDACVEIISDYYPSPVIRSRKFDLILSFSVLEHVPDPIAFLKGVRNNLSADGRAFFFLPDCSRQFREGDLNVLTHEHLSFFTEPDLRCITRAAGLDIVDLNSAHDAFIVVLKRQEEKTSQGDGFCNDSTGVLTLFHDRLSDLFNSKYSKIRDCLDSGQRVGFHGVTEGLNTFLALSNLGSHPRISIYDGDKSKDGYYIGSSTSAIQHPSSPNYVATDLMVISSLSFEQEIRDYIRCNTKISDDHIMRLCGT